MNFDDILKHNKEVKRKHKEKCSHEHKGDIRVIFKRCLDCGKLCPVRDEDYIKEHGEPGKGYDF